MATFNVNSIGTACPGPITDLIRAYKKAQNGDMIVLVANDPGVVPDAKIWCERTRNEFVSSKDTGDSLEITIKVTGKKA
ncbi:sulfurtransferase TusA family protein [Cuniculiplasma divulgatum]|uniref:SirA family protein n=1 Tax=Cuniculiplasma divulgatum TaxID=1673428 RepID=A0A1R4A9P2_9ARCH|nr:sulfurtransferase TusA family protein [Cuniculiplasma divulgatum]SJK85691.1 SirA family protein [Cuniculiplasma divulgatum]